MKKDHPDPSVRRRCSLLSLARSSLFCQPRGGSAEALALMELIDRQILETPWYGSRRMARHLHRQGHGCGRHRVRRLMRVLRLVPIHQEPETSRKHPEHRIHPYPLRDLAITRPIPASGAPTSATSRCGAAFGVSLGPMAFDASLYLVAIMDRLTCPPFRPDSLA